MLKIKDHPIHIMIVEDDTIFVKIHSHLIKENTFIDPIAFQKAGEGLQYLDDNIRDSGDFVIFLDLNMPEMDGWEFINQVTERPYASRIHIIVVTSSTCEFDFNRAINYKQVIKYLVKPLKRKDVEEVFEEINFAKLPGN